MKYCRKVVVKSSLSLQHINLPLVGDDLVTSPIPSAKVLGDVLKDVYPIA